MATKKAASNARKSAAKKPAARKSTTKVTTVKAVESRPARQAAAATSSERGRRFSLAKTPLVAAWVAEFIGTFFLASVIVSQQNQPIALLFTLIGVVLVLGGISGAHLNPAITVGAWVTGKIRPNRAIGYLVAQILGAMLALVVLNGFIGQAPDVSQQAAAYGQTAPQLYKAASLPDGKQWSVLFAELLGTIILGIAYASALRVVVRRKLTAALTIGGGMFVALVIAGTAATYVGATAILNPAGAIALQAINIKDAWPIAIYFATALVGGVIGFVIYDLIRSGEGGGEIKAVDAV